MSKRHFFFFHISVLASVLDCLSMVNSIGSWLAVRIFHAYRLGVYIVICYYLKLIIKPHTCDYAMEFVPKIVMYFLQEAADDACQDLEERLKQATSAVTQLKHQLGKTKFAHKEVEDSFQTLRKDKENALDRVSSDFYFHLTAWFRFDWRRARFLQNMSNLSIQIYAFLNISCYIYPVFVFIRLIVCVWEGCWHQTQFLLELVSSSEKKGRDWSMLDLLELMLLL